MIKLLREYSIITPFQGSQSIYILHTRFPIDIYIHIIQYIRTLSTHVSYTYVLPVFYCSYIFICFSSVYCYFNITRPNYRAAFICLYGNYILINVICWLNWKSFTMVGPDNGYMVLCRVEAGYMDIRFWKSLIRICGF